jgi:hypothetical protein
MISEDLWEKIKEHFLKIDEVQKQGEALKIRKKMFAMLSKGSFVVKLPKERVKELLDSNEGLPYDPGTGTYMKEWVIIPTEFSDKWTDFAEEARKFALTLAK